MFPRGAPGFALLLLRVSIGTEVLTPWETHRGMGMLAITIALSITLFVGFLTPIAALLTIPVYLLDIASPKFTSIAMLVAILQAIALALLGPGSSSVDAHLYGRRVIVIPSKSDRDTS
jgi:putative oxidoreductase